MTYTAQSITCATVLVTETTCPTPFVTYDNTPEIWFEGNIAKCQITIDAGEGETIDYSSVIRVWDGASVYFIADQVDYSMSVQTVILEWEMLAPTDVCRCDISIYNTCENGSGWIGTSDYTYDIENENIVATSITATPSSCEEPCDITISVTWQNMGSAVGTFLPGYTIDGTPYDAPFSVTLSPGQTHSLNDVRTGMLAGSYIICPSPNP